MKVRNVLVVLGVLVLAAILSALISRPLGAQSGTSSSTSTGSAPVTIVSPLPVPVSGSTTVSGSVAATQSGTWNVGISGNSATAPLLVRDVDNPARNRFVHDFSCTIVVGATLCEDNMDVPSGVELVIESVSAFAALPSGTRPLVQLIFNTGAGSQQTGHSFTLPLSFVASFSSFSNPDRYGVTQPLRAYVDGGQTVFFIAQQAGGSGGGTFSATVTGYFVNCGSGSTTSCPLP